MNQSTPYIHLLTSPNGHYAFDVNRNELLKLDDDCYIYLKEILEGKEPTQVPDAIQLLQEDGYLSTYRVTTIQHPYTPYLNDILLRSVSQMTLQITQNCNFRCAYCGYTQENGAQRSHSSKHMTMETAKKALDFLRDHSVDSERVIIGFYGGEPLIEFPLIKELVKYGDTIFRGKNHFYTMTTNATLLTDEMIHFFGQHDFNVIISLDGPQRINDKNRVFINGEGTYQKVIERLNHISKQFPDFFKSRIALNMVIDPSNSFEEISSIFRNEPVMKSISFQSSMVDDTYSSEPTEYSDDYRWQYQYQAFLCLLSEIGRFPDEKVNPFVKSHFKATKEDMEKIVPQMGIGDISSPGGPCIPGKLRVFVTSDGDLLPCERVTETSDALKIGTLDAGYDLKKVSSILNVGLLTPEACRNCWAFHGCNICCKHATCGHHLDGRVKLKYCEDSKNSFEKNLLFKIFFQEVRALYPQRRIRA